MTITSELIDELHNLHLSGKQMAAVLKIIAARDEQQSVSRASSRERQRRYRERHSNATHNATGDVIDNVTRDVEVSPPLPPLLFPPAPPITTPPSPPIPVFAAQAQKRASRLPEEWSLPDEYRVHAEYAGLSQPEIDTLAAEMHDWSRSTPKAVKLDWFATWRGFVRRYQKERKPNANSRRSSISTNVSEQAFALIEAKYDAAEQATLRES